ncbi:MAG TPA: N-acetylmuramoyl-L-alanine amidase [Gemmatimonadaceae bacterium]|nr:N-acetylmuramoyl-L-alanine amidase [Gemmatimonadaceae bacterium]
MRWSRYGVVLLLAIGACVSAPASRSRPIVAIDPGHPSETSSGAEVQNGITEVHIAWEVAQRVQALLRDRGYDVVLTKSSERQLVTNRERAEIGNRSNAALTVRLHCDASSDSGFALYHPDRQGTVEGRTGPAPDIMRLSRIAAESLHAGMAPILTGHLKDGGVRGDSKTLVGSRQGALTGSIFSDVPVVLIEMVTLSNRHDADFIKSDEGQALMARAIVQGIERALPR